MTDYVKLNRRPLLRSVALRIANIPAINWIVVPVLKALGGQSFRRFPVLNRVARLKLDDDQVVILRNTHKCQNAKTLFWCDGRLPSAADRLALNLAISSAGRADVFLDIGSYTGMFSLAVARSHPALHAYAYEILPENFLSLWENVISNNLVDRVHPALLGIGAKAGTVEVPATFGLGVLPSAVSLNSTAEHGVSVPVDSLDAVFSHFGGRMTWKIDVEGFEWPVLDGARSLIARVKPDIVCEILADAKHLDDLQKLLGPLGYHFYNITDEGIRLYDSVVPLRGGRDWYFTTDSPGTMVNAGWAVLSSA